ncbi:MAG: asparaginase domain-containing protein, partial [Thaumarchaeota archaeon]|nr:asparaginase domain-containing protein [Nitrososphaerota archaeon]
FSLPVVFVGAQRSSDRPSSDAALNLTSAAFFAVNSRKPGVYLAMHQSENDDYVAIHSGVRVRKNHTSRRDAFESIDTELVARVKGNEIIWSQDVGSSKEVDEEIKLRTSFASSVALLKFHPAFDPELLKFLSEEKKIKGLIIEGTGLGHVSDTVVSKISDLVAQGIFVGITSQCIWGHVDLNVYDTGRDLLSAGAVPLENMISETALAKLSWAVANFKDPKSIMQRNLLGEFFPRLLLNK